MLILGDYLLQQLELLDRPLSLLFSYIERLFDRVKQFFTRPFPTWSPWPDLEPDDSEPAPMPPTQLELPPRQSPLRGTQSSIPRTVSLHPAGMTGHSWDIDKALDLSLRHSSVTQSTQAPSHYHYATSTLGQTASYYPQATATLDWNPHSHHKVAAPLAPSSILHVSKTTATLVQSDLHRNHHHHVASLRPRESDSTLNKLWSEAFCAQRDPVRQRHQMQSASSAQLRQHQQYASQPQLGLGLPRVNHTPCSELSLAHEAMQCDHRRGIVNRGNVCFVSCLLQSLAVLTEFVNAVQLAAKQHSTDDTQLLSSLSDVLSALHQPCGQPRSSCAGQSWSAVEPDTFLLAVSRLLPSESQSQMIDTCHQSQQDAAEFLSRLLQLLRPRLRLDSSPHGRHLHQS